MVAYGPPDSRFRVPGPRPEAVEDAVDVGMVAYGPPDSRFRVPGPRPEAVEDAVDVGMQCVSTRGDLGLVEAAHIDPVRTVVEGRVVHLLLLVEAREDSLLHKH